MGCVVLSSICVVSYNLPLVLHTVLDISPCTICSVWSKMTLIKGYVGGAGADPPSCKVGAFFLKSMALSVLIFRKKIVLFSKTS